MVAVSAIPLYCKGENHMKKLIATASAVALGLGLAACDSPAENAMEDQAEAVEDQGEMQEDMLEDAGMEEQADMVEEQAEETADAMEEQADDMDATPE
ncbi:hypothetical protein GCM10010990_21550 [Croceicoccus mobilis]|uniref:Uncharacterized protein n=2 Tax=Croceicoccus mobilis TaxID=1703339 RepID=A0A917DVV3_9SPHN|nr:hypothetical protein GCM10010990_21550 [Croceicoccus mobilis]